MTINTTPGAVDANSYASVAEANAYFTERGQTAWADFSTSEKEIALIRATDLIDALYVFRQVPETNTQALQNPRYGQEGVLHKAVVRAAIILAGELILGNVIAPEARIISSEEKELEGVGSTKITYADNKARDPYPMVTAQLARIAHQRSSSVGIIRMVL